jgi:hypothetical protein
VPEVLIFTRKKIQHRNRQVSWTCSKKPQRVSVHTSVVMVSLYPLSPAPLASSAVKTPEDIEYDSDDPEPANEGDIQME